MFLWREGKLFFYVFFLLAAVIALVWGQRYGLPASWLDSDVARQPASDRPLTAWDANPSGWLPAVTLPTKPVNPFAPEA